MNTRALVVLLVAAACQKSTPAAQPVEPAPAPKPAAEPHAAASPLQLHVTDFFTKVAAAIETAKGDCELLASGLEPLAPDAKQLAVEVRKAGHDADTLALPPDVVTRLNADPQILDRCDKTSPRARKALDDTLVELMISDQAQAMADALGRAFAVK